PAAHVGRPDLRGVRRSLRLCRPRHEVGPCWHGHQVQPLQRAGRRSRPRAQEIQGAAPRTAGTGRAVGADQEGHRRALSRRCISGCHGRPEPQVDVPDLRPLTMTPELDLDTHPRGARLVVGELGERHEADALIGVLLEHRELGRRGPPVGLAGDQLAEVGDLVPGGDAARDRLEQVGLLVHDCLLLQRRDHAVGARDDRVVELAPRPRHRALQKHALVARHDRGDVLSWLEPGAEQHRLVAAGGEADQVGAAGDRLGTVDRRDARAHLRLHAGNEAGAVVGAAAEPPDLLDRGADRAHGDEVPARLPPGSVESEHAGVGARQDIGADRAGDRRLGAEPVLRGLVEQRQRTYDNALELGGLAVIGDVYTLASLLILLGAAPEREPLDVDEHARHLQPMAAALMHADAAVFVLDADAWRRIGGLLALVAEAVAHGSDRLLKRDPAFELLCFDEQRHSVVLRPAVHGLGGGLIMACTEPSGRGTTAADVYRARPVVVDARGAVSNRLACTTRLPSMLVTARRNGASTRVPGIGASASSMSRPSDRNLTSGLEVRWPAIGWNVTAQTTAGPA